ncbi:MAG: hypothetical protein QGG71_07540 [Pirellulaceae bacterium]|jgi:hypothetical protein|nr:hypothetical protein [Pirellulaceae bacterium]
MSTRYVVSKVLPIASALLILVGQSVNGQDDNSAQQPASKPASPDKKPKATDDPSDSDSPQETEVIETTHIEVDPIRLDLGRQGKIETIAMDRHGHLLVALSWAADRPQPPSKSDTKEPGNSSDNPQKQQRESRQEPHKSDEPDRQQEDHQQKDAEADKKADKKADKRADKEQDRNSRPAEDPKENRPAKRRRRDQPKPKAGPRNYAIKLLDADGKIVETWPMSDLAPKSILACDDGTIYVAGEGKLAKLDASAKVLKTLDLSEVLDGAYVEARPSGLAANDHHIYIAFGIGRSLRATEDIVRFDREFGAAEIIIEKQFGCCSNIDLDLKDDVLLIAENSRHRMNRFSLDGELLERWGKRDRRGIEGFGACCNPVNFDFGPDGVLYTAESGLGRVKRYSPEGEFLGVVGFVDTTEYEKGSALAAASCYIPVEVAADGRRVFVMDIKANVIRVLEEKKE